MFVRDALGEFDHRLDVIGCHRPLRRLADVERLDVRLKRLGVMARDVPNRLLGFGRGQFQLVLAGITIVGEVANIGDVDDVGELVALPLQRPPERVGEDIGAHVADVGVIVYRRPAAVDPRLALVDGNEGFERAGERVEQRELGCGHGGPLATAGAKVNFPRHCEEPQATRQSMTQAHGWRRYARNDEGG